MISRFLPWRFLIKRAARAYGFIDPAAVLARVRQFSQPSEVQEPIELVRAGIIMQARGLINTRVIQFNLDWVWPHWIERQFNPDDPSFIPRAFSVTHINLTQRNWTAAGLPDIPLYPLVDPRGLFTPLYDGWSIDFWIIPEKGAPLFPSKLREVEQRYEFEPNLVVRTIASGRGCRLETLAEMVVESGEPSARVRVKGFSEKAARLCVSIRPYNPEGIQFIEKIAYDQSEKAIVVDNLTRIEFDSTPEAVRFSDYDGGDVFHRLIEEDGRQDAACRVGLATGAALFKIYQGRESEVEVRVPLGDELQREFPKSGVLSTSWRTALQGTAALALPDERIKYIYDCAVHTLIMLSALDVYPGPYGYRRFWFRDACLMLNALTALNLLKRSERVLSGFPSLQLRNGYFRSQEGEWDSNGQVLWIMNRFLKLAGQNPPDAWLDSILKGADWIIGKRMKKKGNDLLDGLLPAGFSAEHLGPNDYYYWDDFWCAAGLKAAGRLTEIKGLKRESARYTAEGDDLLKAVFRSIDAIPEAKRLGAVPASPNRRMDAGAIGSMVSDWPLKLTGPDDVRMKQTAAFLMKNCFHRGGFFQDMVHSGVNVYLTLSLAQTLLRFGNNRYQDLIETCIDLASPTGQWPEAVHPFSGGGCMGDGQHGWAAAEWVLMIRNLFVREEDGRLIIGSGVFPQWLESGRTLSFGPTPTPYGPITVYMKSVGGELAVEIDADWRGSPPALETRVRGYENKMIEHLEHPTRLKGVA